MMRLTDEELRDVLTRAAELDRTARHGEAWNAEREAVIGAGEEIGLSRHAVERALMERLEFPASPPAVGSLAWARSADGRYYVAEVLSLAEDGVGVRFLRGSEHRVGVDELRACAFIPGERVACQWPMWGPWTCTVVAYDAARQRVRLSDGWGQARWFPLDQVWLAPANPENRRSRRLAVMLLGIGAAAGAVIGSIITALVIG